MVSAGIVACRRVSSGFSAALIPVTVTEFVVLAICSVMSTPAVEAVVSTVEISVF